jgi:hypothetical protein
MMKIKTGAPVGYAWVLADTTRDTHGTYFGVFGKWLNLRKCLTDAALEVVPGGGIEPSTHGFPVRLAFG